ncbi:MAG: redoxin family protein [Cytophagales bacterium]|nr:redoxin family protein [Armatimonadota bacterium]
MMKQTTHLSPSRWMMPAALVLGAACVAGIGGSAAVTGAANAASRPVAARSPAPLSVSAGKQMAAVEGKRATVLVFVGTRCPISNGYAPDIAALAKAYQAKGVSVVLVYPNAGVTRAEAEQHAREYGLTGLPRLLDPAQSLADSVGATLTPEAAVLDSRRAVRYTGRIDNKHIRRAASARPGGASQRSLRTALDQVLAGKPVASARLSAVGCAIERAATPVRAATTVTAVTAVTPGPTYARDIAPILNQNCVSCHRSGEIGPMPLGTYAEAKRFARNIAGVTEARLMPPWKPVGMDGAFHGERKLTDPQIKTLTRWAEMGAPQGDPRQTPPAPKFATGWKLGPPDLVLTMPAKYAVPASGPDIYRCFVIPTGLTEDKQVVAVEYRAGNKRAVHHCLGYLDTSGAARKKDAEEVGEGYTSFGGPGFLPTGEVGGWAPGNLPQFLPDGMGKPLTKGSDLVLQMHYHPSGKPEEDRTSVGIYFAKKPITRRVYTLPVLAKLDIPAGKPDYQTSRTFRVPINAEVISVTPHMHLLGRTFSMTAHLPDGTAKPLINIDDWDFNWQDTYTYQKPLILPKGTSLTLNATYDNSASNPRNPSSPPKWVGWGEATTDEMCIGFVSFVTDDTQSGLIRLLDLGGRRRPQKAQN